MSSEYVHQELNQEVTAIGGCYVLVEEVRLPFQGREVLYLVGHAAFETCCGTGGCAYALVPGFVRAWKTATNSEGRPVSQVEPIQDPPTQAQIRRLVEKRELVQQIQFQ